MTRRKRTDLCILLPAIALIVAACGGTAPVTSGAPNTAPSSPAGDQSTAPPSGSLDAANVTLDLTREAIVVAAERENADRRSGRDLAGMAAYLGPDAPALVAAMDELASDALWKVVDDAAVASGDANIASISTLRPPAPVAALIPPPGMSLLGPWVTSLALLESSMESGKAYSKAVHDQKEVALGPNKGSITTDTTTSVTPSGSRLIVDVTMKTTGEANDANGRLVFRINGTGHAHVEVEGCPDAQGIAPATMAFSASEDYFIAADIGRFGNSWQENDTADAQIFANDNADLDHEVINLKADRAIKGGTRAAGAAQSDLISYTIDATESITMRPDGTGRSSNGTFNAKNITRAEIEDTYKSAENLIGLAAYTAGKAAEKFWRSGKCVEVVVDPMGGDVAADSTTSVTTTVRHRFEGNELQKPVEAALSGVKSIEPAGQKVPAPATFTYTAGSKQGDTGEVTFKSVSNRGIGETAVKFTVGGGWKTESDGSTPLAYKGQKCNGLGGVWKIEGTIGSGGLKTTSTWSATIDEKTLVGPVTYKSVSLVSTSAGSITTTSTGTGQASLVVQADGTITMTIAPMMVTTTGAGQGLTLQEPATSFTWTAGGTCPA